MAEAVALHKFARISSTKVRMCCRLIQGRTVQDAQNQLHFMHNRGAKFLFDVVKSAAANAEVMGATKPGALIVKSAVVESGPMYKRLFPRSRGQAAIMRTRFSHIKVILDIPEV
jgi:large subunit ribosomal protein L22